MYIYDIIITMITSLRNLFQSPQNIIHRELTEHQKNRVDKLKKDIEDIQKSNSLDINKMFKSVSKINRRINRTTDIVIIIKFIENELRDFNLMKQLEPEIHEITIELIERNSLLLDLKNKFSALLSIKDKEDKINRIMYGV